MEESVKVTVRGATPSVGVAEKSATGGGAVTVMQASQVLVSDPPGPPIVRLTVHDPTPS